MARLHAINPRLNIFSFRVNCIDIRYKPSYGDSSFHSFKLNNYGIKFLVKSNLICLLFKSILILKVVLLPNGMFGYSSGSYLAKTSDAEIFSEHYFNYFQDHLD